MKKHCLLALVLCAPALGFSQDTIEGSPDDYIQSAPVFTVPVRIPAIDRLQPLLPSRDLEGAAKLNSELQEVLLQYLQHGRTDIRNMALDGGKPYTEVCFSHEDMPIVDITVIGDLKAAKEELAALPGAKVLGVAECAFYGQISVAVPPDQLIPMTRTSGSRSFIASAGMTGRMLEEDWNQAPQPNGESSAGARAQGAATNQAEDTMGITRAKQLFTNPDGGGFDIGTLSDSANRVNAVGGDGGLFGIAESQNTGDLPPDNRINNVNDSAGGTLTDEGRAMMEVIYDVADNCGTYGFGTAFGGESTFAANITALGNAGMDVINDDVINFHEPIYFDGPVSTAVNNYVDGGGIYFSLNHNYANNCYEGVFNTGTDGDSYHAFNGTTDELWRFTLTNNATLRVSLQWGEMYGNATVGMDFDLLISDGAGGFTTILSSNDPNVGGDPHDYDGSYVNITGATQTLYLAIQQTGGNAAGMPFKLRVHAGTSVTPSEYAANRTGMLTPHAGTPKSIAVGAADYQSPNVAEAFSSHGPHRHLFNSAGNPIDLTYTKPDFLCYDGVDTSFFGTTTDPDATGFPNFFGTSCATPNAAAVGVIVLDVIQDRGEVMNQTDMKNLLRDTLEDLGDAGHDFIYGYGRINGLGAVTAAAGAGAPDWWAYPNQFGQFTIDQNFSSHLDKEYVRVAFDLTGSATATVSEDGLSDPMIAIFDESDDDLLGINYNYAGLDDCQVSWSAIAHDITIVEFFSEVEFAGSADFVLTMDGPDASPTALSGFNIFGDMTFDGNLFASGDADFHSFTVPQTTIGSLSVEVDPEAGLNTVISLFDSNGNELATSNNSNAFGAVDTLTYNSPTPGEELVLAVYPHHWESDGDFEISLNFATVPGQPDDLGVLTTIVDQIARPNPVTGVHMIENQALSLYDTHTTYLFPATGDTENYALQTAVDGGGVVTSGLYDDGANRLAYDGDPFGQVSTTINHTLVGGQDDYYYTVFGTSLPIRGGSIINFRNIVVEQPEPYRAATRVYLDPDDGINSRTGSINPFGDNDYYTIIAPVNASGSMTVSLGSGTGFDGAFDVYGSTGTYIGTGDNAGSAGTDTLNFPVTPLGTYHVLVRGDLNSNVNRSDSTQIGSFTLSAQASVVPFNNEDSDGDGFSDQLEDALGSDSDDPDSNPFFGDFDFDSFANMYDALALERALPVTYRAIWDVDMDGNVDSDDALAILLWSTGAQGYEVLPIVPQ